MARASSCSFGRCDKCHDEGYFGWCVTNSKEHLHACKKDDCKTELQKRLGTWRPT